MDTNIEQDECGHAEQVKYYYKRPKNIQNLVIIGQLIFLFLFSIFFSLFGIIHKIKVFVHLGLGSNPYTFPHKERKLSTQFSPNPLLQQCQICIPINVPNRQQPDEPSVSATAMPVL